MTPVLLLTALLSVADPQGDAIGQGNLTPPTAVEFRAPGIFDVQHIDVLDEASFGFELTMGQLTNPWQLPNGFSFPIIEIYLSTHSSGQTALLPGSNMNLAAGQRWNYAFRITGDEFEVYRATDQALPSNVTELVGARLELHGNVLRVHTNITMPERFSVFGMVGSYDPFTETGWRAVTAEPSPWAFSSREPSVPVIDVIADSFGMQRAALAQGVLPEIRSAVRHDGWLIVAAVGFVFMLIGSVGQLLRPAKRTRPQRFQQNPQAFTRQQAATSPLASAALGASPQLPQPRPAIGRASRGQVSSRVSNNTTRGLARQQARRAQQTDVPPAMPPGASPNNLSDAVEDALSSQLEAAEASDALTASSSSPETAPETTLETTLETTETLTAEPLTGSRLKPAVASGLIAPAGEVRLRPASAAVLMPQASGLAQHVSADSTADDIKTDIKNDLKLDDDAPRAPQLAPHDTIEAAHEVIHSDHQEDHQDDDNSQDNRRDNLSHVEAVVPSQVAAEAERDHENLNHENPDHESLDHLNQVTSVAVSQSDTAQDVPQVVAALLEQDTPVQHVNTDTDVDTNTDADTSADTDTDTPNTDEPTDTDEYYVADEPPSTDQVPLAFYVESSYTESSYSDADSAVAADVQDAPDPTWDASQAAENPEDQTRPETAPLRPAELIKRERLAAKAQLEFNDSFLDDTWFEWPNSSDIFSSSNDESDDLAND